MKQEEIDYFQQDWLVGYALRGKTLNVGCGMKPIHVGNVVNLDANPDKARWADVIADVHDLRGICADGEFDVVVSNHVLPALRDPVVALREMARVLRPGGIMAHVIPDRRYTHLKRDAHHPFDFQTWEWKGPHEFAPVMAEVADALALSELEDFEEFEWSFKVVAVRI